MPLITPDPTKPTPGVNPSGSGSSGYSLLDIGSRALRLIGVLAAGESVPAQDGADLLIAANHMLDAWNAEGLMVYSVNRMIFNFVPDQDAYTLGPGGDWNTVRPAQIEHVSILSLANPVEPIEYPVRYLTDEEWSAIQVKDILGTLSYHCWDDGNYPLRRITWYYIPSVANQAVIYGWQPLPLFNSLADSVIFPPGYAEAIAYNLAARLAPEWQEQVPEAVAAFAISSLARIKTANARPIKIQPDPAISNLSTDSLYVSRDKFISGY